LFQKHNGEGARLKNGNVESTILSPAKIQYKKAVRLEFFAGFKTSFFFCSFLHKPMRKIARNSAYGKYHSANTRGSKPVVSVCLTIIYQKIPARDTEPETLEI
jgi:hypothetical protein